MDKIQLASLLLSKTDLELNDVGLLVRDIPDGTEGKEYKLSGPRTWKLQVENIADPQDPIVWSSEVYGRIPEEDADLFVSAIETLLTSQADQSRIDFWSKLSGI